MIRFIVFHLRAALATIIAGVMFETVVRMLVQGYVRWYERWFVPVSFVVYMGLVVLLIRRYVRIRSALWDMALLALVYIATILLMILTEWRMVIVLLKVLGALTIGMLVNILLSNIDTTPVYIKKAYRRMRGMAWVFVNAAMFITAYAVSFFFEQISLAVLFLFVGAMTSLCSYAIWRMYFQVPLQRFTIWLLIIAVMSMELFWVIHLLPFGYMVLGFFATWLWYLLLLLIRFHISTEGIRWKEQRRFLFSNAIMFIALLFVIRWI